MSEKMEQSPEEHAAYRSDYRIGLDEGRILGLEEAASWCDAEADGIRKRMQAFERMNCDDSVRDLSGDLVRARTRAASIRALIKEPKV